MLKKWNVKRYVDDETGVSLIMAVMTLLVLSIIGVTLATVTFANVKLTTTDREYQSAYYIAEAGVNETYAEIKSLILDSYAETSDETSFYTRVEPALLDDISDSTLTNFERSLGEQPEAQISITKIDDGNPRTYQISSEGKIGQRERTVTKEFVVNWVPKTGPSPMPHLPEGVAAIVKNNITLKNGGHLSGDVYLDTKEAKSFIIEDSGNNFFGDLYLPDGGTKEVLDNQRGIEGIEVNNFGFVFDWGKLDDFFNNFPTAPVVDFHENVRIGNEHNQHDVIKDGNLYINSWLIDETDFVLNLDRNYHFYEGNISGNNTLEINVGHENRVLVFDKLEFNWGHLKINGTGSLTIFVKDSFKPNGGKINTEGDIGKLTLYYEGSEAIDFTTVEINSNILFKNANVTVGSGGGRSGLLVTGGSSVKVNSGAYMDSIIVAPYARVELANNGATTTGVIIADKLEIREGPTLQYKQVDTSEFPFDFITVPNVPAPPGGGDTGGLLTPKPNVE